MTKTVCDICGCNNPEYHCVVPMKTVHEIYYANSPFKLGEFHQVELKEIDLCWKHGHILAGFLDWLKTAKEGDEYNVL